MLYSPPTFVIIATYTISMHFVLKIYLFLANGTQMNQDLALLACSLNSKPPPTLSLLWAVTYQRFSCFLSLAQSPLSRTPPFALCCRLGCFLLWVKGSALFWEPLFSFEGRALLNISLGLLFCSVLDEPHPSCCLAPLIHVLKLLALHILQNKRFMASQLQVLQCRQVMNYSLNYLINLRFIGLGITVELSSKRGVPYSLYSLIQISQFH